MITATNIIVVLVNAKGYVPVFTVFKAIRELSLAILHRIPYHHKAIVVTDLAYFQTLVRHSFFNNGLY
jgi:hypothetical protein